MIDHINNLKLQYLVELSKLGETCVELERELEGWLNENDVVFDGSTIPFVLMPHFISASQQSRVRHAVDVLARVLDRFCDEYPNNPDLQAELALSPSEHELICLNPGYPRPMRICRLDAFLSGNDLKFLEFNADSPAGIGYTDVLHEGLSSSIDLPQVQSEFETVYEPMMPKLLSTLMDAYNHVRSNNRDLPERPRLALLDVNGSPSVPEFNIMCQAAQASGLDAFHGTLEDVDYDGSTLQVSGQPAQLVYRRALFEGLGESPLMAAVRDGRVCVVNPLRSRVANNKKLFAVLQDPRFANLVHADESAVIKRTIPWTRILRPGKATYGSWNVDLLPFVIDNRERLVIKPASDYGGHNVWLGVETEQDRWEQLVEDYVEGNDFVVQEYVPVPEEMFPTVGDGSVNMRLKRFNINPFSIGGSYAGSITRISDQAVINVSAGGGLLPSVIGSYRQKLLDDVVDIVK